MGVLPSVALVAVFIVVGGFFAAAEIALVSLRESQLESLREEGGRGRKVAELADDPNRFLAAVQIGVTFAGFLSAAFGAATIADEVAPLLVEAGLAAAAADVVALIGITLLISYASLVLSELVPKRLALQRAEGIARFLAGPIDRLAVVFRPLIWLLGLSTNLVVRLLGGDPNARAEEITQEEIRQNIRGHTEFDDDERRILDDVFESRERQVREVMIPRTEVEFLDAGWNLSRAVRHAVDSSYSRFPVVRGTLDDVVGFVHVRDLFAVPEADRRTTTVASATRDVDHLPGSKRVLKALSDLRRVGQHIAVVADEYGGTAGIVTLEDLIEEIIGDIKDEYDDEDDDPARRGGEREVDGLLNLEDFAERTGCELPEGPYETVAGYVVTTLGRLPEVGDVVEAAHHRLSVVELDGRRVARVRVSRVVDHPEEATGQDAQELGDEATGDA